MFKLNLNVEISVLERSCLHFVLVLQIIELVHLKRQVLVRNLQLSDSFVVGVNLLVEAHLLLLQDHRLRLEFADYSLDHVKLRLEGNKGTLVSDPVFLDAKAIQFEVGNL